MKARDLLHAVDQYAALKAMTTDQLLQQLPEDQFRELVVTVAVLFSQIRVEAQRRGIWDDLKTKKAEK